MGTPPRVSRETAVTVSVGRNKHAPRFTKESYSVEIAENLSVGHSVLAVSGQDSDTAVSLHYMVHQMFTLHGSSAVQTTQFIGSSHYTVYQQFILHGSSAVHITKSISCLHYTVHPQFTLHSSSAVHTTRFNGITSYPYYYTKRMLMSPHKYVLF